MSSFWLELTARKNGHQGKTKVEGNLKNRPVQQGTLFNPINYAETRVDPGGGNEGKGKKRGKVVQEGKEKSLRGWAFSSSRIEEAGTFRATNT